VANDLKTITLTTDGLEKLEKLLANFCAQTNIIWAILITSTGHLLAQRGFVYSFDVLTIAALTSNIFNSTMELARLIGERKFNELLQEGKNFSIYYITVDANYLLVSMFDDRTIPGVVKVASEEFSNTVHKIVQGEF